MPFYSRPANSVQWLTPLIRSGGYPSKKPAMATNHQGRLNRIRKRPGNQRCCDCSEVDPSHASILPAFPILWSDTSSDQIGVLCCQTCSLVHKSVLQRDNEMDIRVIDLQSAELCKFVSSEALGPISGQTC
eukprot:scaffold23849_cov132-Cylindrotheca_fusiformis.AAC.2